MLEVVTKFGAISQLKIFFEYAPDMKQFQRAYLRLFLGLNFFMFS